MDIQKMTLRFPFCLLSFLGLTLFAAPVAAQVFDSGPSDPALFDTVINIPTDLDIGISQSVGGDGSTTQINVFDGGSVGGSLNANSGIELNIRGGSLGAFSNANSGSEVNISGGNIDRDADASGGSIVNITGGTVGMDFHRSTAW